MIGSVIQLGINMAAYAVSAKAVRAGAKAVSSNFKRIVKHVNKQTSLHEFGSPELRKRILDLTSDKTINRTQRYVHKTVDSAHSYIKRNTTPGAYRALTHVGGAVRDEALFLPANYLYYRMEKHRAVTPEEKDSTKSFGSYYMGLPMVTSIGSGILMNNFSMSKTAIKLIGRKTGKNGRERMVRGLAAGAKGGAIVMDLSIAAGRTAKRMIGEYGLSSMISFGSTVTRTKSAGFIYKSELRALKNEPTVLEKRKREITSFEKQIDNELKKQLKGKAGRDQELAEKYRFYANKMKEDFSREVLGGYADTFKKHNGFMDFMNDLADNLKEERFRTRRITDRELGVPMNHGQYFVGGTKVDFGRMNMAFMKDLLIKGAGHGAPKFLISMFGQDDIVQYQHSDHALGTAFTKTRSGSVYLGKAYFDPDKRTRDIAGQIIGEPKYAQYTDAGNSGDMFYQSQIQTIKRKYNLDETKKNVDLEADVILSRHYRRGSIPVKSGDFVVHQPGGALKLYTTFRNENNERIPFSVRLGGIGDNQFMEFYKFTRESSSSSIKSMRHFLGSEGIKLSDGRVETIGPTPLGQVIRDEEDIGLFGKLRDFFDIGYSEKQFLGKKATSILKKFTDPRNPKTFFDKRFIGSPEFQNALSENLSNQIELTSMLRRESTEAMEYFTAKASKRAGGRENFIKGLVSLNRQIGELDPVEYMIHDEMSGASAHESVLLFNKLLGDIENKYNISKSLVTDDIKRTDRIRDLFIEADADKYVSDIFAHTSGSKKMFIDGSYKTISRVDEYNAMVLRVTSGLSNVTSEITGRSHNVIDTIKGTYHINYNNPSELAAYSAAAHLSNMQHKIMRAISDLGGDMVDSQGIAGNRDKISEILSMYSNPKGIEYKDITGYYNKSFKHSGILPWEMDSRLKIEDSIEDEIFAIPKDAGSGMISKKKHMVNGREVEIAHGIMDAGNIATMNLLHSFNRVASEALGAGLDETRNSTPGLFIKNTIMKRILPGIGAYIGYSLLDRAADYTLDGTPFGEGFTVFGANVLAGARVAAASIFDATGVTAASKYLEDLMPGFIESPLSGLARFAGPVGLGIMAGGRMGGSVGSLRGGLIGTAVGALLGGGPLGMFGQWNINKSREEVVDILAGREEVPVRKGRFWELGKSDFLGTRIEYYRPHMYAMLRSGYKQTPGYKETMLHDVAGILAPDLYAMQNYYSRPYPVTAGLFSNIPVVSNVLGMIPGSSTLFGEGIEMHRNDWSGRYYKGVAGDSGVNTEDLANMYGEGSGYFAATSPDNYSSGMDSAELPTQTPITRGSAEYAFGETMNNLKDIVGMRGFLMGAAFTGITGRQSPFDYAPALATAADAGGIQREYWDLSIGGGLGMTEALRRYLPDKRSAMEVFNPIINAMPSWLPDESYMTDFQHGDSYTKIAMGEARLPGPGYETLHNVDISMPIESDILAENLDSQIAYFLGMPEYMMPRNKKMELARNIADQVREKARQFGDMVKGEGAVYNANLNTRATVDAIIKDKTGNRIPVKVMPKGFGGQSSLNAYLAMSELDQGLLVEVDTDSGNITEQMIKKDITRFASDISRTQKARFAAYNQIGELEKSGKAMNLGNAYSWFDRYKILADVGMYSPEFREADAIVQQQMDAGYLRADQVNDYYKIKNQVSEKEKAFHFSEYRFLNLGSSITESGREKEKEIRANYNSAERIIGGAWEYVSHFRTPVHSKLLHKTSALEEYERNVVYGKTMPMWENPYEDFIKGYAYQMAAEDDPLQNAVSWGTGAVTIDMLTGLAPSIGFMAGIGAMVAGGNAISDNVFVPDRVLETREIQEQMDAVEFARWKALYNETGDKRYAVRASRTMAGSVNSQKILDPMVAASALGGQDKYYFEDILSNVTKNNFSKVAQLLPESSLPVLYNEIGDTRTAEALQKSRAKDMENRIMPGLDSSIYDNDVPIEIPAIQTFEMAGLNSHDAGLGWYSQMSAMNRLKAMGKYKDEALYASRFETQYTQKDIHTSLNNTNRLREALRKIAKNVNIIEDGVDRIEVEVIM